jgi:hypothetical protein
MMTANVQYIFFIALDDAKTVRFEIFFDFLTRLSSTKLLTFNFNESMFLLKSMTNFTMSKKVRSISNKLFDSERLSFIARLSRVNDDDDEIINVD